MAKLLKLRQLNECAERSAVCSTLLQLRIACDTVRSSNDVSFVEHKVGSLIAGMADSIFLYFNIDQFELNCEEFMTLDLDAGDHDSDIINAAILLQNTTLPTTLMALKCNADTVFMDVVYTYINVCSDLEDTELEEFAVEDPYGSFQKVFNISEEVTI